MYDRRLHEWLDEVDSYLDRRHHPTHGADVYFSVVDAVMHL